MAEQKKYGHENDANEEWADEDAAAMIALLIGNE